MRSVKLARRYAAALLEHAKEVGLPVIYRQALLLVLDGQITPDKLNGPLGEFMEQVPQEEWERVLTMFLDFAREEMNLVPVEIISAVPLTEEQVYNLEIKLIRHTRRQLEIRTTVDPELLGGLKIIVGNTVIDESIKRGLTDMKAAIYKGVYLRQ